MKITNAIGWCHATVNFWWGCDEVSPACAHCYAREWSKFTSRHLFGQVVEWGQGKARAERLEAARREALALERVAIRDGVRYRVFSLSMGDWLDEEVPIAWLAFMLRTIRETPHLDWILLTKRPENWRERIEAAHDSLCRQTYIDHDLCLWIESWMDGGAPVHVWIGVTVENQKCAEERIPALLRIPARVRFLSCEPLLGPIDFVQASNSWPATDHPWRNAPVLTGIHWVIAGGESGHHARPTHPDWARSLRDQCAAAGVPFYWKQWGEWMHDMQLDGVAQLPKSITEYPVHQWGESSGALPWPLQDESYRIGKAAAGRLLDGVEHSAFPDCSAPPSPAVGRDGLHGRRDAHPTREGCTAVSPSPTLQPSPSSAAAHG